MFPSMPEGPRPGPSRTPRRVESVARPRKRAPNGESPLRASECYRFVLSNPDFNVCMTGPSDAAQMREALSALDAGPLTSEEMTRARRVGANVAGG